MGISRPPDTVHFGVGSVGVRVTRRAVPGKQSRIPGDVRPRQFCELLKSLHIQMGTWIWARPDLYLQRQRAEPAEQCAGHHFLYTAAGLGSDGVQQGRVFPGHVLLGVRGRICVSGFYSGFRLG